MMFQFHNGTINTEGARGIIDMQLRFNSTTVQLIPVGAVIAVTCITVSIPQRYN